MGTGDFPLLATSQPLRGSVLDLLLFVSAARNVTQTHASCVPGIRVAGAGSRRGGTTAYHGKGHKTEKSTQLCTQSQKHRDRGVKRMQEHKSKRKKHYEYHNSGKYCTA